MTPVIDLLALWDEVFEMKQEKQALNGEPHSQPNPYSPYISRNSHPELLGDQTGNLPITEPERPAGRAEAPGLP